MVHATRRTLRCLGPVGAVPVLLLSCLSLIGGVGLVGCASPARTEAADPIGAVPGDLWIEVVVTPGRGVADRARVEERPARFVLLPDGSMHGETDVLPEDSVRPARVRRLAREQLSEIWSTLRAAGFTNAGFADVRGNVRLLEPLPGEVLATLEVHADGERFAFARRYLPGAEDQVAMRRVVRSIASLGWASDEALAESAELPLRYDLGADPYARFTRPAPARGEQTK
jgi:hypothetical protein